MEGKLRAAATVFGRQQKEKREKSFEVRMKRERVCCQMRVFVMSRFSKYTEAETRRELVTHIRKESTSRIHAKPKVTQNKL